MHLKDGGSDLKGCHWCMGDSKGVNGAAEQRASFDPFVRLAALHGDPAKVIAGIEELDDGLDMPHLLAQFGVLLPVLKYLAA
jgi:hypothetical protein